jgi:hypothetical protein
MRKRMRFVGAIAVLAALAGTVLGLISSRASAQGQAATQRVIVVLKNQDQAQPATPKLFAQRHAAFMASQAPVVSQLQNAGASSVQGYTVVDAVSATVSSSEMSTLQSDPAVSEVVPDGQIQVGSPIAGQGSSTGKSGTAGGFCPAAASNGKVELDPQALQTINADSEKPGALTARSLGLTGAGVKVAFIADGVNVNDPDFIRPDGQHVFVDYKDFSGDGTSSVTGGGEAFLDSSSIAAQGRTVYGINSYSALGPVKPCNIRVEGVAPGASLVGLDVFGANDVVYDSTFLEAINYAVQDKVNVLNESLGSNLYPDDQGPLDVIKQANDAATAAGVTVTVSAGDAGVTSTIGTPATDPDVIDAGASTTFRGYAELDFQGYNDPGVHGWLNDNISGLSSAGYEQDGQTVDLVAPGDLNWALCSPNPLYEDCGGLPLEFSGGTSESAPLTAGVAALVIQAYREGHGGATPTPAQVKQLIVSNTDDIGSPADQQGAGRLDAYKASLAALSENGGSGGAGGSTPVGRRGHGTNATPTVLDGQTSLNVVDQPSTAETLQDTISNPSAHRESLSLSARTLGAYTTVKSTTVTLANSDPQLGDETGESNNLQTVTFNVPTGENRLDVSLAFAAAAADQFDTVPQLTLIDPAGKYAAFDLPQGNGNYGDSQVTDPTPGQWTALIYAPDPSSMVPSFTGPVSFQANVAQYTTFGTVSPSSISLRPGQTSDVTLDVTTPSTPGDSSGAIVVSGAGAGINGSDSINNQTGPTAITTIPVTLRSVIPSGPQSFTDQTTGGNGRSVVNGQTFYYGLDVPAGAPEVDANIALANNSGYPFSAWLVDPSGIAEGYTTNVSLADPYGATEDPTFGPEPATGAATDTLGAQLHVLSPAAGRWTVIIDFGPTAGGLLNEPFTVTTGDTPVPSSGGGLPDSSSTQLPANAKTTYDVTVANTGTAPETFFPDARLGGTTQLNLAAVNPDGGASVAVPNNSSDLPTYLVPTDSTSLTAQASTTGTVPISFDTSPGALFEAELGDPDIGSTTGLDAIASYSAQVLPQGGWDIAPNVAGVFGKAPQPTATVTTSMSVTTSPFDSTVSSPTGDLEADGVTSTKLAAFAPVTVPAGKTAMIPVTITPTAASGTQVSGTLYLDDYVDSTLGTYGYPTADQVAQIPYSYTVK